MITSTALAAHSDDDDDDDQEKEKDTKEEEERQRMETVRDLQMAFYAPSAFSEIDKETHPQQHPSLNESTGILSHLPIVRDAWTEVPGRSNVLNVQDPIYTNMFEKIIRQQNGRSEQQPMYYGHLFFEKDNHGGFSKDDDPSRLELQNWKVREQRHKILKTLGGSMETQSSQPLPPVVGTVMKISDFRRMANGGILLLVQAMERFVVHDIQQRVPYAIANVQIIPDLEEVHPSLENDDWVLEQTTETQVGCKRAMAVTESLQHYHSYEYDANHVLPEVPTTSSNDDDSKDDPFLSEHQYGSIQNLLARVVPFSPYSKTLDPPPPMEGDQECLLHWNDYDDNRKDPAVLTTSADLTSKEDDTLELRLIESHILLNPHMTTLNNHDDIDVSTTNNELEYELWLLINKFLVQTRSPVSPILLGLIPPNITKWPFNFNLNKIGSRLTKWETMVRTRTQKKTTTTTNQPTVGAANGKNNTVTTTSSNHPKQQPKQPKPGVSFSKPIKTSNDYVAIPMEYPDHRRQRRLSYSAGVLLEELLPKKQEQAFRQKLLQTPTTFGRLNFLRQQFQELIQSNDLSN